MDPDHPKRPVPLATLNAQLSTLNVPRHRWMFDWASPWEYTAHAVRREIYHRRSEFQDIEIVETEGYGRCLLLDGEVQSFEADEHMYHESLVHPAMLLHPQPRRVLVIGGGEGATLRELLRYRSVEQALMVDLDPQVVAATREHLPSFHAGSFDDPRVRLEFGDGRAFVERSRDEFDVIVVDVTNPMAGGASWRLFTVQFYEAVRQRLATGGIVALQSDSVSLHGLESAATIHQTVRAVWPRVFTSAVFLPAYTTDWSFTLAGRELTDPLAVAEDQIDERIRNRLNSVLRFYDGTTHHRLFRLPRYVREASVCNRNISRDAAPIVEVYPGFAG
jgi:spermidine synthase